MSLLHILSVIKMAILISLMTGKSVSARQRDFNEAFVNPDACSSSES
jgi:hypothetical protein